MLDRDLAAAYHVSTAAFNQAVKRNLNRFPDGFRFQLTKEEHSVLISQIVTSKHEKGLETRGGYYKLPYAFTKQCGKFTKTICGICHDRFIIADQKEIYWSGASLKDAGRLTFAAAKLGAGMIPGLLKSVRNATSETRDYSMKGGK